jgi:2-oxoglutarate dehydrogenase E1 component
MKRFGLEGCDSFIAGMKVAMDACVEHGAEKAVIGMPHRGRLNMLANVVRKPLPQLFAEFVGTVPLEDKEANWSQNTGDAKYHLGTSYTRTYPGGKELTVEVLANPSHLECINPVVMGRVRAKNHIWKQSVEDEFAGDRTKVIPFLIHGDAAFSGQGVVYESIQMQDLKNYTVGGTIHVIVNNQIGFTTVPAKGRSGMYCSDLAKSINAPIFHVNADSAEDVHHAFKVAAEYRQIFNHDVVIDLIGYRKYGHNELDQPSFTQPMMYKQVAKMEPVARKYEKELLASGDTDEA